MQSKKFITYYGEYSLKHWIRMILCGEITLPVYQRFFVWKPEKVLRLVDSINKGLFVPPVILSSFSGDNQDKKANYILDGQQRLSAILIACLGFFPNKFSEFETELLNDDNASVDGTSDSDEEDKIHFLQWNLKELQKLYCETGACGIEELRQEIEKTGKYIKINADFIKKNKDKISQETFDEYLAINIDDDFLSNHYLGFSYIKPVVADSVAEKNMFSSIFRNINISSVPLLPEESRAALYWLKPEVVPFLDPKIFENIKVNKKKIDFVRSLAYISEVYTIFQKKGYDIDFIKKVAIGYGRSRRFEDYFEKYVYCITENKNSDTFGLFRSIFPDYQKSIDKLYSEFNKLDLPKEFSGLVELDFYLFGLLYWVLFENKAIDKSQKTDLKQRLEKEITKHKKEFKSATQLGAIRERIKISISTYKRFLEK